MPLPSSADPQQLSMLRVNPPTAGWVRGFIFPPEIFNAQTLNAAQQACWNFLTEGALQGSFSLWEAVVPPGAGAPPHTHDREDEAFYVLSGELLIEFEGEPAPHRLGPGGFFFGARRRRHAFRNVSDQPTRVLILSAPSHGLDQMFAELEAATASGMPGIETLAAIAAEYGVTVEPPTA